MKTRFTFLCVCFFVCAAMYAAPVDSTRALQIAKDFVPKKAVPAQGQHAPAAQMGEIVYTHYMPKSGKPAIYVVNIGNAFAIVSADDVAHPILGYNFSKSWPTDGNLPPQVKSFFDDLAAQIEAASEHPQDAETAEEWLNPRKAPNRAKANNNLPDSVGPLLTTTWDQGQYYNSLCPEDGQSQYDGHVLTGCVATAMAQIINYWGQKEPIKTRGTHSYQSNYGTLEVDFGNTNYDFAHMPNALTSESTPEEVNAVAKLTYECGVAVNMSYGPVTSGAYDVDARAALINFFKISPDASFAEKANFRDDEWSSMLKQDIASGKPVYYCGHNEYSGGHAFVCNGYQKDDYFYFNFGWSGVADGWYLTDATLEYTSNQAAILGIVPNAASNVILGQMEGSSFFVVDEPLEFCHIMGCNKYNGTNYNNSCNNNVIFSSLDNSKQLVLDIINYKDQSVTIYDGNGGNELRVLNYESPISKSPIVSPHNVLELYYNGNLHYDGFRFCVNNNSDCRLVSNINVSVDTTTIHLSWTENGAAKQWEIEYGLAGFSLGNGKRIETLSNTYDFIDLQPFTEYDFYIRSKCGGTWLGPVTVMSEAPYWDKIVNEQPSGYIEDENGYIEISSAEALAWWAKRLHLGCKENQNIKLSADINLGKYKWRPIYFKGTFDGQGHKIDSVKIIEDYWAAFITAAAGATIKNVNLTNCYSKSKYTTAGALVCDFGNSNNNEVNLDTIMNCYVSGLIVANESDDFSGGGAAGAIVCNSFYTCIINCAVNCRFRGNRSYFGGVLGLGRYSVVKNCYSASIIESISGDDNYYYTASVLGGNSMHCHAENCYGYEVESRGCGIISPYATFLSTKNISWFSHSLNGYKLLQPIYFEKDSSYHDNFLEVLNLGVQKYNNAGLRLWKDDIDNQNDGMPILGDEYEITCPNVANIKLSTICNENEEIGVVLSWDKVECVSKWVIQYHIKDSSERMTKYTQVNPDTIWNLEKGRNYIFNIRPLCTTEDYGAWSYDVSIIVEKPYWKDVVTSQPEGYIIDSEGNVAISTPEGMAWLISTINGFNGQETTNFSNTKVYLTDDISMGQYRWTPIWDFNGIFDGQGHNIDKLIINENSNEVGLFGRVYDAGFSNITLTSCSVNGKVAVGGLVGFAQKAQFENCIVNGEIVGEISVGGILGYGTMVIINDCSSTGNISSQRSLGGLCGEIHDGSVKNCFSHCSVKHIGSENAGGGGLIGGVYSGENPAIVENSFATGDVVGLLGNGGLLAYLYGNKAKLYNCYASGYVTGLGYNVAEGPFDGALIGSSALDIKVSHCYGLAHHEKYPLIGEPSRYYSHNRTIIDTASFVLLDNEPTLLNKVFCDSIFYDNLIDVLNAWVREKSDSSYRKWILDEVSRLPVLGEYFYEDCPRVTNIQVDSQWYNGVRIIWNEMEENFKWEVEYGRAGFNLGEGKRILVSDPIFETNLITGEIYDLYIRTICENNTHGAWSEKISVRPDKKYWNDVVVTQPDGYLDDGSGNIYISTPEGLAWLVQQQCEFENKIIHLKNDVNINAHKWSPIKIFRGVFDGHGHTISGLYLRETDANSAFIDDLHGTIMNVSFNEVSIQGKNVVATIAAFVGSDGRIINCSSTGNLETISQEQTCLGGLACYSDGEVINSYAKCNISGAQYMGGINGLLKYTLWGTGGKFDAGGDILNCYSACKLEGVGGSIVGRSVDAYNQLAYFLYGDNALPCYSGIFETAYSFAINELECNLSSPLYKEGIMYISLVDALNAWVNANNSEGIYRHWVEDTENVNGGFPIFDPNEIPVTTDIETISTDKEIRAEKILRDGQIFILRGERVYTIDGREVR